MHMYKIRAFSAPFSFSSAAKNDNKSALTGNRTRASRVAGENSTTEPSVLLRYELRRMVPGNFPPLVC